MNSLHHLQHGQSGYKLSSAKNSLLRFQMDKNMVQKEVRVYEQCIREHSRKVRNQLELGYDKERRDNPLSKGPDTIPKFVTGVMDITRHLVLLDDLYKRKSDVTMLCCNFVPYFPLLRAGEFCRVLHHMSRSSWEEGDSGNLGNSTDSVKDNKNRSLTSHGNPTRKFRGSEATKTVRRSSKGIFHELSVGFWEECRKFLTTAFSYECTVRDAAGFVEAFCFLNQDRYWRQSFHYKGHGEDFVHLDDIYIIKKFLEIQMRVVDEGIYSLDVESVAIISHSLSKFIDNQGNYEDSFLYPLTAIIQTWMTTAGDFVIKSGDIPRTAIIEVLVGFTKLGYPRIREIFKIAENTIIGSIETFDMGQVGLIFRVLAIPRYENVRLSQSLINRLNEIISCIDVRERSEVFKNLGVYLPGIIRSVVRLKIYSIDLQNIVIKYLPLLCADYTTGELVTCLSGLDLLLQTEQRNVVARLTSTMGIHSESTSLNLIHDGHLVTNEFIEKVFVDVVLNRIREFAISPLIGIFKAMFNLQILKRDIRVTRVPRTGTPMPNLVTTGISPNGFGLKREGVYDQHFHVEKGGLCLLISILSDIGRRLTILQDSHRKPSSKGLYIKNDGNKYVTQKASSGDIQCCDIGSLLMITTALSVTIRELQGIHYTETKTSQLEVIPIRMQGLGLNDLSIASTVSYAIASDLLEYIVSTGPRIMRYRPSSLAEICKGLTVMNQLRDSLVSRKYVDDTSVSNALSVNSVPNSNIPTTAMETRTPNDTDSGNDISLITHYITMHVKKNINRFNSSSLFPVLTFLSKSNVLISDVSLVEILRNWSSENMEPGHSFDLLNQILCVSDEF